MIATQETTTLQAIRREAFNRGYDEGLRAAIRLVETSGVLVGSNTENRSILIALNALLKVTP